MFTIIVLCMGGQGWLVLIIAALSGHLQKQRNLASIAS